MRDRRQAVRECTATFYIFIILTSTPCALASLRFRWGFSLNGASSQSSSSWDKTTSFLTADAPLNPPSQPVVFSDRGAFSQYPEPSERQRQLHPNPIARPYQGSAPVVKSVANQPDVSAAVAHDEADLARDHGIDPYGGESERVPTAGGSHRSKRQLCDGIPNCVECTMLSELTCLVCAPGYVLVGNTCQSGYDGGWSEWSAEGGCSATCGEGIQNWTRTCTNPPQSGAGAPCSGSATQLTSCNSSPCSVDGGWSDWAAEGDCSMSCGGGIQNWTRTCTNSAPANGGNDCEGVTTQQTSCNTDNCPVVVWYALGALMLAPYGTGSTIMNILTQTQSPYMFDNETRSIDVGFIRTNFSDNITEPLRSNVTVTNAGPCAGNICSQWLTILITGVCDFDGNYTVMNFPLVCQDGQTACVPGASYSLWEELRDTWVCNTNDSVGQSDADYSVAGIPAWSPVFVNHIATIALTATKLKDFGQSLSSMTLLSIRASVDDCPAVQGRDVTGYGALGTFNSLTSTAALSLVLNDPNVVCSPQPGAFSNLTLVIAVALVANYGGGRRRLAGGGVSATVQLQVQAPRSANTNGMQTIDVDEATVYSEDAVSGQSDELEATSGGFEEAPGIDPTIAHTSRAASCTHAPGLKWAWLLAGSVAMAIFRLP